jgi:carboxymethylenebutenolidase
LSYEEFQKLTGFLRQLPAIAKTDCHQIASDRSANFYQGYVMSRRLNRAEYLNTVRDLFGGRIDFHLDRLLPADAGGGEGFDTTGSTLFTSSIHLEKYLAVAEQITRLVLPDQSRGQPPELRAARDLILFQQPGWFENPEPKARAVIISTSDGKADAWFYAPETGKHPAVILWPDIAGLRAAYQTMGARLASAGYAVLVVNHYYRGALAPVLDTLVAWRTPEGQAKLKPLIARITPEGTVRDASAFVGWLDSQAEVDTAKRIGTCGYCMGGPYTVRTAFAVPARIGAAASFHGAGLVGEDMDSPDKLIAKTQAAFLFAIAQNDDASAPSDKDALRAAAKAAGRPAEIEVYPAQHGWCTIDAPIYNQAQAEKAWGRMLALFATNL